MHAESNRTPFRLTVKSMTPLLLQKHLPTLDYCQSDIDEFEVIHGTKDLRGAMDTILPMIAKSTVGIFLASRLRGIYGIQKLTEELGLIWFLSDGFAHDVPKEFYRKSKIAMETLMRALPPGTKLINYVDGRNNSNVKWLKKLGFYVSRTGYLKEHEDANVLQIYRFVPSRPNIITL